MASLNNAIRDMRTLEDMAEGTTVIHVIHPFAKIIVTFIYIVLVISFNRYDLSGLIPFILYPVIIMALAEIPYRTLFYRFLIAFPFAFFAGIFNVFLDREVFFYLGGLAISYGLISFLSLLLKTLLSVMAVLILAATTPLSKISYQLVRMKMPNILVMQITMTYRYISVLAAEAHTMFIAYILRSPRQRAIKMKDMGVFLGGLLLRSFDRAERVYAAMKCRGFSGTFTVNDNMSIKLLDVFYMLILLACFVLFRYLNFSVLVGGLFNL